MKSKVIRLNELQIMVLKQYLSYCSYYIHNDLYGTYIKEQNVKNDVTISILKDINRKLEE